MTKEPEATSVDGSPIDVETISDTVDTISAMELSTSTREEIDDRTARVVGHLNLLLAEDVWEGDEEASGLFRESYRLLELSNRPGKGDPVFEAFTFMRESATLTGALLSVFVKKRGLDDQ
ncbi:hypothetical protein [Streptomyces sp. ALI-76-A]|uniref:hypothetical protein n=1 Tax=Streptomyces sp. ALI-76-A TaxID=3025736 RepID=UPI00256F11DA|nr:hypothetical protein [Streptomyces sp. ALI-76-A]MDL5204951.1 hypothetical protein [Streptomyces sp. ALI-76-A]